MRLLSNSKKNIKEKGLFLLLILYSSILFAQNNDLNFESLNKSKQWDLKLKDNGKKDWTKNWTKDGLVATVENTQMGMHIKAGPILLNDAHHEVLWTKEPYSGDIKIEYDFTRTDNENRWVNILYIQASGDGEGIFESDISQWSKLREVPAMKTYFENMNALHISYAAFENSGSGSYYMRARRYPKPNNQSFDITEITPSYDNKGFFKSNQKYHITVLKTQTQLFFRMQSKDGEEIFYWNLKDLKPIAEGRIGLRQMYGRSAIYKNIKIYTK